MKSHMAADHKSGGIISLFTNTKIPEPYVKKLFYSSLWNKRGFEVKNNGKKFQISLHEYVDFLPL